MKFAIDVRGVSDRPAGKEQYVLHILEELTRIDRVNSYLLYSNTDFSLPFALPKNFTKQIEKGWGPLWHLRVAQQLEDEMVDSYFSALSYLVPVLTKVKTIVVVHDLTILTHPETMTKHVRIIERCSLKPALRKASVIVTDCDATSSLLRQYLGQVVEKKNLIVVPLGVDSAFKRVASPAKRERLRSQYQLPKQFILYVGTLEPRKNIPALLEAYWLLSKELKDRFCLVLVGKRGWKYQEIFAAIRHLGVVERVLVLDYIKKKDLPTLYSQASVFVLPSQAEGFGLPMVEAMSCGLPVLINNTAALTEVANGAALIGDANDPKGFSKLLQQLLIDTTLRSKLRAQGLRQVKQYRWALTAKKIHHLLIGLGNQKGVS